MEWLQKILKGIAEGKTAEEIQKEIQTELPKHFKPSSEFNTLNEKVKTLESEKKALEESSKSIQTEYDNYKKGSISQQDYETKVKEINENAEKLVAKAKLDNAIDMYLIKKNARNVKSVKANLDLDKVSLDGDNLLGLEEQVEKLVETDAYLFSIESKKNNGAGTQGNQQGRGTDTFDEDELDKMSDEEYFAYINKNK